MNPNRYPFKLGFREKFTENLYLDYCGVTFLSFFVPLIFLGYFFKRSRKSFWGRRYSQWEFLTDWSNLHVLNEDGVEWLSPKNTMLKDEKTSTDGMNFLSVQLMNLPEKLKEAFSALEKEWQAQELRIVRSCCGRKPTGEQVWFLERFTFRYQGNRCGLWSAKLSQLWYGYFLGHLNQSNRLHW